MIRRPIQWRKALLALLILVAFPHGVHGQQEKVTALKQSLAANQKQLRQYKWVETTVISLKGEEKSRIQKQCFYGPDGKVQKQQLSAPPQQQAPGGVKGKVAGKKKGEITAVMNQAVALIHTYVPPDPQRIQATKAAGNLTINPTGPNAVRLDLRNYLKSGDTFSLGLDTAGNAIQTVSLKSYLESQSDAVTMDVTFGRLHSGVSYPANIALSVPSQKIQVVIQNSNYENIAPAGQAPAQQAKAAPASAGGVSTKAIDDLTAPIALYPDALIAQILKASTDFGAVQKFAGWMQSNANLKGTELQDAAQAAGFEGSYIALAPFPQVVQMMVEKPDWTRQLGKAFTANQSAVFESIQRLRAAAQALGNLKTTPQQEVQTETTAGGQQVIVIQPANPEVVYVPVYNTQTVYVQSAPPPSSSSDAAAAALIGFTAGVIIGNASSHYYGPYGWHGAAMYNEAWDRREDYYEDRQEYAEDRRENTQENQSQRQSQHQDSQSQRQSASQSNQAQRQGNRQTAASTSSAGSGQVSAQRSGGSGGFSGYESGASARAQSARGSASRSGSRSGGGGRRR